MTDPAGERPRIPPPFPPPGTRARGAPTGGSARPPAFAPVAPSAGPQPVPGDDIPAAPPPPPRPLTKQARRRALAEPHVRFWWLAGLALVAIALYLLIYAVVIWSREAYLIRNGQVVQAYITIADGDPYPHRKAPESQVEMTFTVNGHEYDVVGVLEGRTEPVSAKEYVPIRVDPSDPQHWTYRTTPAPLRSQLIAPIVVAPFAIAALIVAAVLRRKVLRTWRQGEAAPYVISDRRHTAIAPRSHTIRCVAADGRDKRLVTVYVPLKKTEARPGDVLWLIHPSGKPTAAVPAIAFE